MPGYLLHEHANVQCMHPPGQAKPTQPTQTDRRVKVSGQKIVTQPVPYTISGCTLPPPPAGNGPCVTANWIRTSAATRVTASGQPVLLTDSKALCAPTGTGLNIVLTQTRVKGV